MTASSKVQSINKSKLLDPTKKKASVQRELFKQSIKTFMSIRIHIIIYFNRFGNIKVVIIAQRSHENHGSMGTI